MPIVNTVIAAPAINKTIRNVTGHAVDTSYLISSPEARAVTIPMKTLSF